MFNAHVIDCEFPLDVGATVGEDGEVVESSMSNPCCNYNNINILTLPFISLAMALSVYSRRSAQAY